VDKLFNVSLTMEAQDSPHEWARPQRRMKEDPMIRCLLIDKNPAERQKVAQLLASLGIVCVERQDAEEGIRYCSEADPDVVMMEASALPAAKEFLRLARHKGQSTGKPVVILYADRANLATMGETILDGAAEFLIRPFDRDLLQFKLAQAGVLQPHYNAA